MSLHQSRSLKLVCKTPRTLDLAHSTLFSVAVQDGELAAIVGVVLCTHRDPVRYVKDPASPPDGSRMFPRPVQTLHP